MRMAFQKISSPQFKIYCITDRVQKKKHPTDKLNAFAKSIFNFYLIHRDQSCFTQPLYIVYTHIHKSAGGTPKHLLRHNIPAILSTEYHKSDYPQQP